MAARVQNEPVAKVGVASCPRVQAYRGFMTLSAGGQAWIPESCTLPTAEQPVRVAEFDHLFADAVRAVRRPGPGRLELLMDPAAESVARDLAARESGCCSFFTFDFTPTETELVMGIEVPDARTEVLDSLAALATTACEEDR